MAVPAVQVDPVFEGAAGGPGSLIKFNPLTNATSQAGLQLHSRASLDVSGCHWIGGCHWMSAGVTGLLTRIVPAVIK
jgi:hypothetical protein